MAAKLSVVGGGGRRGRKPKEAPGAPPPRDGGIGDNTPTEAERKESAYRVRMAEVRRTKAEVDKLKALQKAAQKIYTKARNDFKSTTDISLENLDLILKKSELHKADLIKDAIDYDWMAEMEGIPRGGQMTLITAFEKTPTATKDALDWEQEGWRAFGRGVDATPPSECGGMFVQAWMKGWQDHQSRVAWSMAMPQPDPVEAGEGEGDDSTGDEFEASPAELERQLQRQAVEGRKSLDAIGEDVEVEEAEPVE
jgi:hypothetical protein